MLFRSQAGLTGGVALGEIGVKSAKETAAAETAAQTAKTEAASQLYEQLTGEQKLDKELQEGMDAYSKTIRDEIGNKIAATKHGADDDEETVEKPELLKIYIGSALFAFTNPKGIILASILISRSEIFGIIDEIAMGSAMGAGAVEGSPAAPLKKKRFKKGIIKK